MNIAVCVKQVPDTETKIKLNADQSWIDTAGIKWIVSPFDEYAIEEALRLRDKNPGSTVTIFSAGPERVKESIRSALAMGADNGVHVDIPERADSFLTAKALAGAFKKIGQPDIIFMGKEGIDDGAAQVSQLVATQLEIPCGSVIVGAEYESGQVKCRREIEGGSFEVLELKLPAILTAQKGLNEPRYASLPNIMKAKKKEIQTLKMVDVGVSDSDQKVKFFDFQLPPPKQPGQKIAGSPEEQVKELVRRLHTENKVI